MADFKPILCIDCDGVIHQYSRGWQNGELYDPVVPGFFLWAVQAAKQFRLVIYSSRSKTGEDREGMRAWLELQWRVHCHATGRRIEVSYTAEALMMACGDDPPLTLELAAEKPPAWLTIDDRAVRFDGDWQAPALAPAALRAFKPWNIA